MFLIIVNILNIIGIQYCINKNYKCYFLGIEVSWYYFFFLFTLFLIYKIYFYFTLQMNITIPILLETLSFFKKRFFILITFLNFIILIGTTYLFINIFLIEHFMLLDCSIKMYFFDFKKFPSLDEKNLFLKSLLKIDLTDVNRKSTLLWIEKKELIPSFIGKILDNSTTFLDIKNNYWFFLNQATLDLKAEEALSLAKENTLINKVIKLLPYTLFDLLFWRTSRYYGVYLFFIKPFFS